MNKSLNNKAYSMASSLEKEYLHQIDGELFYFDPNWENIGVNLSGGADSACGMALLCELINKLKASTKIFVISHVRGWKTRPWQRYIFVDVFNKIKSMYPNVSMEQIINYIPPELEYGSIGNISHYNTPGDVIMVESFNKFLIHEHKLETVYNFKTCNPTKEDFKNYLNTHTKTVKNWIDLEVRKWDEEKLYDWMSIEKRPPQIHNSFSYDNVDLDTKTIKKVDTKLILPWILIKKDFIIRQYYKNGWLDLLDKTRSCEGDYHSLYDIDVSKSNPNYIRFVPNYIHGETKLITCLDVHSVDPCYWCVERQWANESAKRDNDK